MKKFSSCMAEESVKRQRLWRHPCDDARNSPIFLLLNHLSKRYYSFVLQSILTHFSGWRFQRNWRRICSCRRSRNTWFWNMHLGRMYCKYKGNIQCFHAPSENNPILSISQPFLESSYIECQYEKSNSSRDSREVQAARLASIFTKQTWDENWSLSQVM